MFTAWNEVLKWIITGKCVVLLELMTALRWSSTLLPPTPALPHIPSITPTPRSVVSSSLLSSSTIIPSHFPLPLPPIWSLLAHSFSLLSHSSFKSVFLQFHLSLSLLFSFTLSFSPLNSLIFFLSPLSLFYALCSSVVSPLYSFFSPLLYSTTLLLLPASPLLSS